MNPFASESPEDRAARLSFVRTRWSQNPLVVSRRSSVTQDAQRRAGAALVVVRTRNARLRPLPLRHSRPPHAGLVPIPRRRRALEPAQMLAILAVERPGRRRTAGSID